MGQCMSRKAAGAFAASAAAAHSKPTSKMQQRQLPVSTNFLWPYSVHIWPQLITKSRMDGWMASINGIRDSNCTIQKDR